jgi:hypothetical protein
MPSFLSQSAICCMAAHQQSRRGMMEFFDHRNRESIPIYPRYHASDGDFRLRFQSISGRNWDFFSLDPCDSMGQRNAKLMLSTLWCGQLTLVGACGAGAAA